MTHGLTPLCFVRESALCCPETLSLSLLNRQTQLIIVEEAQKAAKGGEAWRRCQRGGRPRERVCELLLWQGRLTLDLAAPPLLSLHSLHYEVKISSLFLRRPPNSQLLPSKRSRARHPPHHLRAFCSILSSLMR